MLALVGYFSLGVLDSLGGSADAGLRDRFLQSDNYDPVRGGFVNPNQSEMDDAQRRATRWRNIRDYFLTENQREPAEALPQQIPDYERFLTDGDGLKLIWFGHSSFLLNMEGTVILVDPVFGNASPFSFFGNRYMPPEEGVMAFRDLNTQRYFPVHWGMFTLALHSWFEPIETISRLAEKEEFPLVAPVIGQLVDVSSDTHFPSWWERRHGR